MSQPKPPIPLSRIVLLLMLLVIGPLCVAAAWFWVKARVPTWTPVPTSDYQWSADGVPRDQWKQSPMCFASGVILPEYVTGGGINTVDFLDALAVRPRECRVGDYVLLITDCGAVPTQLGPPRSRVVRLELAQLVRTKSGWVVPESLQNATLWAVGDCADRILKGELAEEAMFQLEQAHLDKAGHESLDCDCE